MKRIVIVLLLSLLLAPWQASAAIQKKGEAAQSSPEASYNPHEDKDDILLPMPNGLKMVLRAVSIPAGSDLSDKKIVMGLRKVEDDRGMYEKRVETYISSSISYEDLPKEWKAKLDPSEKNGYYFYFIGKYEVTNAQWDAVMGGTSEGAPNLPKVNVSWYDIQQFLQKYNVWLLENYPDSLPTQEGSPFFFRLPTEEEWEFAARGGNLPPENQGESDFVMEDGKKVEDYAVFGESFDNPMPIGTKNPNSLGLYDTGGNVAEFIGDGFRYTIAEAIAGGGVRRRFHGANGGFLSKGGSFLSAEEEEVYPGRRVEMRMFDKMPNGTFSPHKARSLGLRLVYTSINVSGMEKAMRLVRLAEKMDGTALSEVGKRDAGKREEKSLQEKKAVQKDELVNIDPAGDPLRELDKIYAAAASPFMKSNLEQMRDLLKDVNASLARERDANLLSNIRSAVYKADAFVNIAFRLYELQFKFSQFEKSMKERNQKIDPGFKKEFQDQIHEHFRNLEISTNYYRLSVKDIAEYPKAAVDVKIKQLQNEYKGNDRLNSNFRKNIQMFAKQVNFVRQNGLEKLNNAMVWKDSGMAKDMMEVIEQESRKKNRR